MFNLTEERFGVLKKFNEALLEGLKAAVLVLENYHDFSADKRDFLTLELRNLIARNQLMEELYGDQPGEH